MTLENMTVSPGLWEYNHEKTKASPPANSVWIRGLEMGGEQAAKRQAAVVWGVLGWGGGQE